MLTRKTIFILFCIFLVAVTLCSAQYSDVKHAALSANEVPVTKPGSYAVPGTTYRLMNDITSTGSTIFLGKDVTLDLNGHTIRYADAPYEHIPNSGFENGDTDWDLSKAPGAK